MFTLAKSRRTYLVAAMPRSGAPWLANLLTYGQSTCVYESGLRRRSLEPVVLEMQGASSFYVGLADEGLAMYWEEIFEVLPLARVIVVERDYDDILKDWRHFARRHPVLISPEFEAGLDRLWQRHQAMCKEVRNRESMVVRYQDLSRIEVCQDIWEFAAPAQMFCQRRCARLQEVRVEPDLEKILNTIETGELASRTKQ